RECPMVIFGNNTFEIWLANLISSACASTPELDSRITHRLHETLNQLIIRPFKDQIERVIARPLNFKVCSVLIGVNLFEKTQQVFSPSLDIQMQTLQLTAAHDASDLRIPSVVGWESENEIRI